MLSMPPRALSGCDPRWQQALVLLSQTGPQLGVSKNRWPAATLPLPVSAVRALLPDRAAGWPCCRDIGAADYMLVFLRQASQGIRWQVMGPGQVESAIAAYSSQVANNASSSNTKKTTSSADEDVMCENNAVLDPADATGPPPLRAALMLPCWMAVQGAFPLNGTYFQTNEVFLDELTAQDPVAVPWSVLLGLTLQATSPSAITTAPATAMDKVLTEAVVPTGALGSCSALGVASPCAAAAADRVVTSVSLATPSQTVKQKEASLPWKTTYFGFSASSICRGMGFAEVAHTFHRSCICIRSFDCRKGDPKALPPWAMISRKS